MFGVARIVAGVPNDWCWAEGAIFDSPARVQELTQNPSLLIAEKVLQVLEVAFNEMLLHVSKTCSQQE